MDLQLIRRQSPPGYYEDALGNWQVERRRNPDRRAGAIVSAAQLAMRATVRRGVDREILDFLSSMGEAGAAA